MKVNFKQIFKFRNLTPFVISLLLLAVSQSLFAATELVRINDSVISLEDFNKKYRESLRFFQIKPPTKQNVLDDLIKRELAIQEAKKAGLDKDPDVVDRMNTVLYHALLDKKLTKDIEAIHVTDNGAKDYYERNPEVRTSHIFVSLRPNAPQSEQKQAYEKIKKIKEQYLSNENMSFAEVAQKYSEGPAAIRGGDMDFQTRDRLDPAYYEAAVNLSKPGKISGIVQSRFGYHIIKLTAVRPWQEVDRGQIKRYVFEEQRGKVFEKYMGNLREQSQVVVKKELLKD